MVELPHGNVRVAFFGGSFDPPHLGHLAVARAAREALGLDTVLFAPVGAQPLKQRPGRYGSSASFADRVAMTRLAIAGEPGLAISLADAPKPSGAPNYTYEALESLHADLPPQGLLFCLMGADSFFSLRQWHRAAEIPFIAQLIVASRPGEPPAQQLAELKAALPDGLDIDVVASSCPDDSRTAKRSYRLRNSGGASTPFFVLPGLNVEISASQIREQLRVSSETVGAGVEFLPAAVSDFIRSRKLYR
jgi:nicotinate-nucleotide adenylyltransferase